MPRKFKKKPKAPKKANKKSFKQKFSRVGRVLLFVLAAILLVLPVLLIAHPVSYVPLVMALLMALVSWLYVHVLNKSILVNVTQTDYTCERGADAGLSVTLTNTSFLPAPHVETRFIVTNLFGEEDESKSLSCSLAPYETIEAQFDAGFAHLGTYQAGIRDTTIHDLLGLFTCKHKDGSLSEVVVQPAKVNLSGVNATQVMPDEASHALKPITSDNEDYASVRDYHRGDPLKTVHWNLSSRNPDGSLYTRLFEEYVNPSLVIIIDHCAPEYDSETMMTLFDGIVECAVALSLQAHRTGVDAEIRYFNRKDEISVAHVANDNDANGLVESLHKIVAEKDAPQQAQEVEQLLESIGKRSRGFGNVAFVTARTNDACLSTIVDIRMRRRNSMAFITIPRSLDGKDKDRFMAPASALSASSVPFYVVESNELGTEVHGL